MRVGEAYRITGSIGRTSKMPGTSYGLPAAACVTGAKLALVPGSICSSCYALKGNYRRGSVDKAQRRRLEAIKRPEWVDAMVFILQRLHARPIKIDLGEVGVRLQRQGGSRTRFAEPGWHRWHDSGDLQSVDHLRKICEVAARTPAIRHWLPTQELTMVRQFLAAGSEIPPNLAIRVSDVMLDGIISRSWPTTSGVSSLPRLTEGAHLCPAPTQGHQCGKCRACWSRQVRRVIYLKH